MPWKGTPDRDRAMPCTGLCHRQGRLDAMKRAEGQVTDATVKRTHNTNHNHMTAPDPRLVGRRIEAGLRERALGKGTFDSFFRASVI